MPEKPRIGVLHVIYSFGPGGTEDMLVQLVNRSDRAQFRHAVCCLTASGAAAARLEDRGTKIYECGKKEGLDFSTAWKLRDIIEAERIDVLHARGWVSLIPCVLAKFLSKRPVRILYGFHGQNYTDVRGRRRNLRRYLLQSVLLRCVDAVYTLSASLAEYLAYHGGIPARKVLLIPNGVEAPGGGEPRAAVRRRYGLSPENVVVGYVGRLDRVKNLPLLLKSFKLVYLHDPALRLVIAGTGAEERGLRRLCARLRLEKAVIFAGWSDRPQEMYRMMDIYVQPSFFEGMSNSVAAAMAHHLPVIATDVGGNADLITDGETGFLIKSDSMEQLIGRLVALLNEPALRRRLGTAAGEYVRREFSLAKMVERYEGVYGRLCGLAPEKRRAGVLAGRTAL